MIQIFQLIFFILQTKENVVDFINSPDNIILSVPPTNLSVNVNHKDTHEILLYFIATCLVKNAEDECPKTFVRHKKKIIDMLLEKESIWESLYLLQKFYKSNRLINRKKNIWYHFHSNDVWLNQLGRKDFYDDLSYICQFPEIKKYSPLEFFSHAIHNTSGFRKYFPTNLEPQDSFVPSGLLQICTEKNFIIVSKLLGDANYFVKNEKNLGLICPAGLVGTYLFWIDIVLKQAKKNIGVKIVSDVNKIQYTENSILFKTMNVLSPGFYTIFVDSRRVNKTLKNSILTYNYVLTFVYLRSDLNNE